jgi:hypothetical protein
MDAERATMFRLINTETQTYGRLMIDPKGFRSFVPTATYNLPVYRRLDRRGLTDEQLAICNPVVLGFCFGVKMWGKHL